MFMFVRISFSALQYKKKKEEKIFFIDLQTVDGKTLKL